MNFPCEVDLEEQCPVCGDKVSGYHYGVLTCESCKGFFKRTVQNNKTYVCVENQQCKIDTSKRKRCPFCRFQKCLNVGMRLEAVRADRMRGGRNKFGPMYKHNRALKQQKKALIQARRLRIESNQKEVTFTSNIHSIAILHNTKLNPNQLPSLSLSQPCNAPTVIQHQITYPSNWAMRLENCSNSADLASFAEAIVGLHHTSSRSISTQSPRIPQLEIEFLHCDPHELQLQKKIFSCLQQEQACRHREANTFSSVCVMADQLLCSIVEWARTSIFFKELKVSDQMRLLHSCWSELLVLEIISRQVLYGIDGGLLLITGQQFRERLITFLMSADAFLVQGELSYVASHAGSALVSLNQRGTELVEKLRMLKVDHQEFACIRFLILFAPDFHRSPKSPKFSVFERGCTSLEKRDVKELEEHHFVESVQQQVEGALLKYTLASSSQSCNRFTCLQLYLSELRSLSILAEDYLYYKHLSGEVPCNNLLNEMLHAKCCWT